MDGAILRTSMGSSVQLPTYNWTKNQLVSREILPSNSIWAYLASSAVSGVCVVCYEATQFHLALMSWTVHRNAAGRYRECAMLPTVLLLTSIRLSPGCITNQRYSYRMDVCRVHYTRILLIVSGRLSRPKGYLGGIKASRFATCLHSDSRSLETGSTAHFLRIAPHT